MAGGLDQAESTRLVSAMLGLGYTAPTMPIRVKLCTSTPTNTAAGTEVSGGGYSRQIFATSSASPAPAAAPVNGATSNSASAITFSNLPAVPNPGITHIELHDSATTSVRKMWGPLGTARIVLAGDSLVFNTSQIVASIGV